MSHGKFKYYMHEGRGTAYSENGKTAFERALSSCVELTFLESWVTCILFLTSVVKIDGGKYTELVIELNFDIDYDSNIRNLNNFNLNIKKLKNLDFDSISIRYSIFDFDFDFDYQPWENMELIFPYMHKCI
jgi:hypothetical protein